MHSHLLHRDYARSLEVAPYRDDREVGRQTRQLVERGRVILQTHRLAATDREHVEALLAYFDPPPGASVLDVGCGVGAVAALMAAGRPDLRFLLLNISGSQLALAPHGMAKICADFHALPFGADSFDALMFTFSLGHGLLDACLGEAARVLRSGGVVFIYDLSTDEPASLIDQLGYRPHGADEVLEAGARHGLIVDIVASPDGSTADFVRLIGAEPYAALGFERTVPMVYRFTKEAA